MTKREIAELMTVLQSEYPDSFKGQSDSVLAAKVTLWHDFFGEYPAEVVYAAAKSFMATDTKGFMPKVGQINEHIHRMKKNEDMTPAEAWGIVYKAICNSAYNAVEEFAKLPPECQRAVGDPQQLRDWNMMDEEVVQSVIGSNFQRSFQIRQNRDRDFEKLPGNVKRFISDFAGKAFGYLDEGRDANAGTSGDRLDRADGLPQLDTGWL